MLHQLIFQGGLANQMFQYVFLLSLREHASSRRQYRINITEYLLWNVHNGYELNSVFGIDEDCIQYKSKIGKRWIRHLMIKEPKALICLDPKYVFYRNAYTSRKPYLLGYWMNEQYFVGIENKIRKAFTFRNIDQANCSIAEKMQKENAVSIHIRRGDYLHLKHHFRICELDYYQQAVKIINQRVVNPIYYVFSDDMNWCKENLSLLGIEYTAIETNTGMNSYKDMYLMTQCKHNIIANSTFSWWGAWLNTNMSKIVIAPKQWFSDIPDNFCPKTWQLI